MSKSLRSKSLAGMVIAAMLAATPLAPAMAQNRAPQGQQASRFEFDGKTYQTRSQCLAAKKRAQKRGTIVGAVAAGAGAALLGGNLGETALVAGGGALLGRELGRNSKKC
ncbi:hypothetical protein [Sandarakinorhabdus sp.]|uniref:hypothetical protein n=1 Tax=Sandarakinorhabdus sp. TaxID=1916663 RepID=UPI00286E52B1|nr:hypothetical protein [Sandarakinorhabdus sp.]